MNKLQRVDAYPLTPAGTHITYLTSTNRNAYQEGDNEVPAKYELGPIIEESYKVVGLSSGQNQESYRYGDTPQVSIDGVILPDSLKNGITLYCTAESANTANSTLRGKFLIRPGSFSNANFPVNKVVFIPLDALFTYNEGGDYYLYLDKYQEVIGVPGVPANTSIEYLGVLGEKSKIQVLSYVGTGTSGEANACSVTASFPIEVLFSLGATGIIFSDPDAPGILNGDWGTNANGVMFGKYLTTTFAEHMGFNEGTGTSLGKKSADGKTFYWYNKTFSVTNVSGRLYYFLALG